MKMPEKYKVWIEARKKYKLSHDHIQMARELGMNPKNFPKIANHKQEPWKVPLAEFIEHCYFKRFKKERPTIVKTVEELVKAKKHKSSLKSNKATLLKLNKR